MGEMKNMVINYNKIKALAVIYAIIPIIIFFIGWLNIISALIFTVLAAAAVYFCLKNMSEDDGEFKSINLSKKSIIAIGIIAVVWCFFAGQGGFVHQSSDHTIRNAILRDLISQPWPVTYDGGGSMMSYYIAHWMVPAVMGKLMLAITGSAFAAYLTGNIVLLLWSSIGCFIVLTLVAMITNTRKKSRIFIAIAMFIFFSGLDIVGTLMRKNIGSINGSMHLEWWAGPFQFSSNMTCLYWVYNQTIVPWIILLCLMNERKMKNAALMGILVFPYGPFPFVGIVILCLLKAGVEIYKGIRNKTLPEVFKDILSPQNIIGLIAVAPVYMLYYTSNVMVSSVAGDTGFRVRADFIEAVTSGDFAKFKNYMFWYIAFVVLEAGLYVAVILKRIKKDPVFIGMSISLLFIPLFQIGMSADFAMRVSIPALVYICIMFIRVVMAEIPDWGEYGSFNNCLRHKKFLAVALIVFIIGAVTPCTEIKREFLGTLTTPYSQMMDYFTNESLQSYGKSNFVAADYQKSDFYKYFCKKKTQ